MLDSVRPALYNKYRAFIIRVANPKKFILLFRNLLSLTLLEKCGIMLEPQEGLASQDVVKAAKMAERLGFGYVLRSDHLLPTSGRRGIDSPECWTTLGAIAVSTSNIKFGPLVSPIGFRNPALLARMALTIHSLSSGRLQLGLGMGWYEDEYRAFGFEFPGFKIRKEQLLEGLKIIHGLTREGYVEFNGKHFYAKAKINSQLANIPLVIGGKSISLVKSASSFADEWNLLAPSKEELFNIKQNLSSGKLISQMGPFIIGEDESEIRRKVVSRMNALSIQSTPEEYLKRLESRNAIIGTPEQFAEKLSDRITWGIEKFYFQTMEPLDEETIALLASTLKEM
jgi:alkanesulfonate monooxygenase SsuD/methylene tetrahydromethanopterin reductase-like flavin-dependent oxidoreductase (luciferase family)